MSNNDQVHFQWIIHTSKVDQYRNELLDDGAILEEDRPFDPTKEEGMDEYIFPEFEPLTIISGILTLIVIVRKVVRLVIDKKRGGVIIDIRKDPIMIIEERALDRGEIVVIGTDGKSQHFESSNYSNIPVWIKKILKRRRK